MRSTFTESDCAVYVIRTWWHPFVAFIVDSMFGALFFRPVWIALGLGAGWLRLAKLVLPTDSPQTVALLPCRALCALNSNIHNIFELLEKLENDFVFFREANNCRVCRAFVYVCNETSV